MKQVNEAIAELLLRHNCVIIPNFGGFIANVLNAQIDLNQGKIEAPKKALTFNTNLINNDGLLANYIAEKNQLSFEDASTGIKQEVSSWNSRLKQGERVEIERVGFLYFDKEQNLNFEQDRFFNLLLSSYGLSDVNFVQQEKVETPKVVTAKQESIKEDTPILEIGNIKNIKRQEETTEQTRIEPIKKKRAFWKYAAAAAFLPIAFYSYWLPMKTEVLQSGIVLKTDFNPFAKKTGLQKYNPDLSPKIESNKIEDVKSVYTIMDELPEGVDSYTFSLDEYTHYTVYKKEETKSTQKNVEALEDLTTLAVERPELGGNKSFKKHLIAGCFSEEDNAHSLIRTLKEEGLNAFVLDVHKGLYRVSAVQSNSRKEIIKNKKKLKQSGINTWLLNL